MRIIGLLGAERAGKSTLASVLVAQGFTRVSFAEPLKRMLAEGFGLSEAQLRGADKEVPTALLCGRTTRYAMQTLGTEWGRDLIGPDVWIAPMVRLLEARLAADPAAKFIVEDVRFANEIALIERLGGQAWTVRRLDVEPSLTTAARLRRLLARRPLHRSQTLWARAAAHVMIENNGSLAEFERACVAATAHYLTHHPDPLPDEVAAPAAPPEPVTILPPEPEPEGFAVAFPPEMPVASCRVTFADPPPPPDIPAPPAPPELPPPAAPPRPPAKPPTSFRRKKR